jgi:hypothetical protein
MKSWSIARKHRNCGNQAITAAWLATVVSSRNHCSPAWLMPALRLPDEGGDAAILPKLKSLPTDYPILSDRSQN